MVNVFNVLKKKKQNFSQFKIVLIERMNERCRRHNQLQLLSVKFLQKLFYIFRDKNKLRRFLSKVSPECVIEKLLRQPAS